MDSIVYKNVEIDWYVKMLLKLWEKMPSWNQSDLRQIFHFLQEVGRYVCWNQNYAMFDSQSQYDQTSLEGKENYHLDYVSLL